MAYVRATEFPSPLPHFGFYEQRDDNQELTASLKRYQVVSKRNPFFLVFSTNCKFHTPLLVIVD